jgi:hypothetical protein
MTRVPPQAQAEILGHVGTAIDGLGGTISVGYTSVAVTAGRLD